MWKKRFHGNLSLFKMTKYALNNNNNNNKEQKLVKEKALTGKFPNTTAS